MFWDVILLFYLLATCPFGVSWPSPSLSPFLLPCLLGVPEHSLHPPDSGLCPFLCCPYSTFESPNFQHVIPFAVQCLPKSFVKRNNCHLLFSIHIFEPMF